MNFKSILTGNVSIIYIKNIINVCQNLEYIYRLLDTCFLNKNNLPLNSTILHLISG